MGSTARTAASLIGISKGTAAKYFLKFREIITENIEDSSPVKGEIEVDKFYFRGKKRESGDEVQLERFQFLAF